MILTGPPDRMPGKIYVRMAQALLVMDVQNNIVSRIEHPGELLINLENTLGAARRAGIPVIYVTVGFRPGFPEVSETNKAFRAIRSVPAYSDPQATAIHPAIAPRDGEVGVTKRRVSAFAGSDLDIVLRAGAIRHLVLTGIATSGVVLSTLREAADKDFELTVLSDCCADTDPQVHALLMEKIFPRQAAVITHQDWIASLSIQ